MLHNVQKINALIEAGRLPEAENLSRKLTSTNPEMLDGWIQLARISHMKGDSFAMLEYAQTALKLSPQHPIASLQEAEALLLSNKNDEALTKLKQLENSCKDANLWLHVAELYSFSGHFESAMRVYEKAHQTLGDSPKLLYNMANAAMALGKVKLGVECLDKVIANNPHDYDAYYNRATFTKQTLNTNHIEAMLDLLKAGLKNPAGEVPLYYALAKECEDIGDFENAFNYLQKGADKRRSLLSYQVKDDALTMQEISKTMGASFFKQKSNSKNEFAPIFILGLPRSGTTLVDRILSSHSQVKSLGEVNDFALAMMSMVTNAKDKIDLIHKSAQIDFDKLGLAYKTSMQAKDKITPHLIDKTPLNFLYIGLISKAMPHAKIIHLRRHPMDSCYAMYKTLFRMGYPFSYDLNDLAQYYIAYHNMMTHWRRHLGARILDVDYEQLVADQESQSKTIIDFVGLEWEENCLNFHQNKSATATASVAQVRQPIYKSSVAKWRQYEKQLSPLCQMLEQAGIAL